MFIIGQHSPIPVRYQYPVICLLQCVDDPVSSVDFIIIYQTIRTVLIFYLLFDFLVQSSATGLSELHTYKVNVQLQDIIVR